ncbi:hypothetical protein DDD_2437 [Nonlabens dokdonensis DSW-6]|uniref:Uncharacterized protein n=1 Tax=Nonlabens dokdonensis (strain DSM 17205 / KCTC 12402 / DSW-6) TaxID=592029 RepID=L7W799_NONDD|nr:hypothetical protein DDD_2437 [Nonlabens dokdonensis DSW-6]
MLREVASRFIIVFSLYARSKKLKILDKNISIIYLNTAPA